MNNSSMIFIRKLAFQRHFLSILTEVYSSKSLYFLGFYKLHRAVYYCNVAAKIVNLKNKYSSNNIPANLENNLLIENLYDKLHNSCILEDLEKPDVKLIYERFGLKDLNLKFIHKYNVRVSSDLKSLLFPLDSLNKNICALQIVLHKEETGENIISLSPCLDNLVVFGWSLVGKNERILVITSNPLDAIAVNQNTDISAVSVPYNLSEFSVELLNDLKSFGKVVFWLNPHLHNWKNHIFIGNTLKKKAFFINPNNTKNAMVCLQNSLNINQILKEAHPLYEENIETFDSYKHIIPEMLKGSEKCTGLKWKRFSVLNTLLKGHRKGELTVFSGQTGTGKTTFMSEYSLDLCLQGRNTLWANFEISNARLITTMLYQISKSSLEDSNVYEKWANKFSKIPMFFLNIHSSYTLKEVLSAMTNAVILFNVEHIVIDNLQFMMNFDGYAATNDQLWRQDQVFSAFRQFATQQNCHVTIVIHPRKEQDFTELNNASISGTAKATQEADNVLILQTTKSRQYLQVTKNRFDGHRGCVAIEFDKTTLTYNMHKITSQLKKENQS